MRTVSYLSAVMLVWGLAGCADEGIDHEEIEQTRAALAPYEDVEVAIASGYMPAEDFAIDSNGGVGIHFINPNINQLNQTQPNMLIYNLLEDGTYELVAAEWFFPVTEVDERPRLFGRSFDGPIVGHHPGMPDHYEMHIWLKDENPLGTFAQSHPDIEPPSFWGDVEDAYVSLTKYKDMDAAMNDGYQSTKECVADDHGHGMGVHFVNMNANLMDPTMPNVLLFMPDDDGGLKLAAAEWIVPTEAVQGDAAPTMFNRTMDGPIFDVPNLPPHYQLHAWLFQPNPHGLFAPFNPMVSCDGVVSAVH